MQHGVMLVALGIDKWFHNKIPACTLLIIKVGKTEKTNSSEYARCVVKRAAHTVFFGGGKGSTVNKSLYVLSFHAGFFVATCHLANSNHLGNP